MEFVVVADPVLLTRAVQNLLSNAVKYTNNGRILVGAASSGSEIRCWVEDTGVGIPEEKQPRIFEKIETDPEKRGGSGLGLFIVKKIMEAHGGKVEVESQPGRGSKFTLTIPVTAIGESEAA